MSASFCFRFHAEKPKSLPNMLVLQECRLFEAERNATWPRHTSLQEKLYGSREELERTTHFIWNIELQV